MALDEDFLGTFHEFRGSFLGQKEDYDFFVARFRSDNKYHLLGYRPRNLSYLFPASSESRRDIGIVTLPGNKGSLNELVTGDELVVSQMDKKSEKNIDYKIVFDKFS